MTPEAIRDNWLMGTTCSIKRRDVREILFVNPTFIVLKHRAHTEYIDRSSGCGNCGAYAELYRRDDLETAYATHNGWRLKPLARWSGRLSLHNILVDCRILGITFD